MLRSGAYKINGMTIVIDQSVTDNNIIAQVERILTEEKKVAEHRQRQLNYLDKRRKMRW